MKPRKSFIGLLIISVLILILTIADFLALHDIMREYVSPDIIAKIGITGGVKFPEFTQCVPEWTMASVSIYGRIALLIAAILIIVFTLRRNNPTSSAG